MIEQSNNDEEYENNLKNNLFKQGCSKECYY